MQQKERKNREQEAIHANVINLLYDIINVISLLTPSVNKRKAESEERILLNYLNKTPITLSYKSIY